MLSLVWIAALLTYVPSSLAAEFDHGTYSARKGLQSQGYDSKSIFMRLDGEDINAFNFNFIMQFALPIGLSYPENAGLALDLTLNYNSRVFEDEQFCNNAKYIRIRRENPVGLGFDFSLGRIVKRHVARPLGAGGDAFVWHYIAPDGGAHVLVYSGANGEYFTHDGSHLKAVEDPNGWSLYFPDGTVHELRHHVVSQTATPDVPKGDYPNAPGSCCTSDHPEYCTTATVFRPNAQLESGARDRDWLGWHVSDVYTQADTSPTRNSYHVEYHPAPHDYIPSAITDRHGRQIDVRIEAPTGLIREIETPMAPDGSGAPRRGIYTFTYEPLVLEFRGSDQVTHRHTVWVLRSFEKPEFVPGERYKHSLTYVPANTEVPLNGGPIKTIAYPSGHVSEFGYQDYQYRSATEDDCLCGYGIDRSNPIWGVASKTKYPVGDPANALTWTFSQVALTVEEHQVSCPDSGTDCFWWKYDQVHNMVDPAGNKTAMRFQTGSALENGGYGLLRNTKYYQGTVQTAQNLLREENYDYFLLDSAAQMHAFDWVKTRIETLYQDDKIGAVPTSLVEERNTYDLFGNVQETVFSGSGVGNTKKVVVADYALDDTVTGNPGDELCPEAQVLRDRWLGNVLRREELLEEDGQTRTAIQRTEYGFSTNTGLRTSEVRRFDLAAAAPYCWSAPTVRPGDVVTRYTYTLEGNLDTKEVEQSGAGGPQGTTFHWDYGYSTGVQATSKNSALNHYDFIRTIDGPSGLVVEEKVAAGWPFDPLAVATVHEYDVLGRTTSLRVGDDVPLEIGYENEPLQTGGVRLRRVRSAQGTGDGRIERVENFDTFGRLEREDELRPDATLAYRHTRYDNAGRVEFVSEWSASPTYAAGMPGTTTDYTDPVSGFEDPFGRPRRVSGPLGEITTFEYFGTNKRVTVRRVAGLGTLQGPTISNIDMDVTTVYYTDALGRLRIVSKPTATESDVGAPVFDPRPTSAATAIYGYDHADRLVSARLADNVVLSPSAADRYAVVMPDDPPPQTRTFFYDALGRQTESTEPERGTVRTLSWNALGDPVDVQDAMGSARGHLHRTTYDAAGRPIRMDRVLAQGQQPLESNHPPGSSSWTAVGWSTADSVRCIYGGSFGSASWYHGNDQCTYAPNGPQTATLTSPPIGPLPPGAILSFPYFREVRNTSPGSSKDLFRVLVTDAATGDWGAASEVFARDSTEISWSRWKQSPAIALDEFSGRSVLVRFVFESMDANPNRTLRGMAIGQVSVRRPQSVVLQELAYDQSFGLSGNKSRGKVTTVTAYDESTRAPAFKRQYRYVQNEGRLSDEVLTLDWDRAGSDRWFEASYGYDAMGLLTNQTMPTPVGSAVRVYNYSYRHGALMGITSTYGTLTQSLFPDSPAMPGIEYNLAGGMNLLRYGNDLQTHIAVNDAFLPNRIWVDRGAGTTALFDTGTYSYDGVRNIKGIGSDAYRYDSAGRLSRATVASNQPQGTLRLDYDYDIYGNMLLQTTTPNGTETAVPAGPAGLHFAGRAFGINNWVATAGFLYDANGNLVQEPLHDGVGGFRYDFSPENRLGLVRPLSGGEVFQESQYDAGGHRWARITSADGGKGMVTLRGSSGQMASEYLESSADSGLELRKEYVHGNGRLLATNVFCGPKPALALANPPRAGNEVRFERADYVAATGNFTVFIETANGLRKTLTLPAGTPAAFGIPEDELFPSVNNWIRIKAEAECGHTGYSDAVSYIYVPGGGGGTGTHRFAQDQDTEGNSSLVSTVRRDSPPSGS